jgi:hypothetical protein
MKRIKYKNIGEELIKNPYPALFGKKDQISRFIVSTDVFQIDDVRLMVVIDNQEVTFELVRESDGVTLFKQEGITNHVVIRRKVKEELQKRGVEFGKEKRTDHVGRFTKSKRVGFVPPTE